MPRRFTASVSRRHALTKRRQKQVMKRRRKQFALPHGDELDHELRVNADAAVPDDGEKSW